MRIWLTIVGVSCVALLASALPSVGVPGGGTRKAAAPASSQVERPLVATSNSAVDVSYHPVSDTLVGPLESASWPGLDQRATADDDTFSHGPLATFHPHGDQVCASGCAASRHPTESLTGARFAQLLADYSVESTDEPGEAFETLLFFGRQVSRLLDRRGTGPLDASRAALLKEELSRGHAELSLRLVDDSNAVRATLPPTRVPLDRRHEFQLQPFNLQPLVASGTVKRVGRDHLWTRL